MDDLTLPQADAAAFDFNNPAFRADPYPAYRFLRDAAPFWRAPSGHWIATHARLLHRDPARSALRACQ